MICLLLAASPAVTKAENSLELGKIDDVFLALDNQKLPADEKAPAVNLLIRASAAAMRLKDGVMALSLAELALKYLPEHGGALEAAARAARNVEQFEQAEKYADRWIRADGKSLPARLLRAELAMDAADWQIAIDQLKVLKPVEPHTERVKELRARAELELKSRAAAVTRVSNLETTVMLAAAEAKRQGAKGYRPPAARNAGEVIVYSTNWCGYCRKAKEWLAAKGVAFISKDVEKDAGVTEELATKAAAAGVTPHGVPVIDVRGTLVLGFDVARLEKLL